jgi:hypothetical protein
MTNSLVEWGRHRHEKSRRTPAIPDHEEQARLIALERYRAARASFADTIIRR